MQVSLLGSPRTWFDKIKRPLGYLAGATSLTTLFLRYLSPWVQGTIPKLTLTFATGAAGQTALQALGPKQFVQPFVTILLRNSMLSYFGITQIYLNSGKPEFLIDMLTGMAGTWFAAKVGLAFFSKLSDVAGNIDASKIKQLLHLCCRPNTRVEIALKSTIKFTVGGSLIGLDFFIPSLSPHPRNIGLLVIGLECGDLGVRAARSIKKDYDNKARESLADIEDITDIPKSIKYRNRLFDLSHTLGTQMLGVLFFFSPNPIVCFFAGVDLGALLASNEASFEQGIDDKDFRHPTADTIQVWINRLVPAGGIVWYVYGMVESDNLADRVALTVFSAGAISAATVTIIANRHFSSKASSLGMNTLRFYTREGSFVVALPAMYIQNYMNIGNIALAHLKPLGQFFAAIAWLSIGANIGNSLFTPFVYDVSPSAQVNMGRLFAALFTEPGGL